MFKENGRVNIVDEGIVNELLFGSDGEVSIVIGDEEYVVINKKYLYKAKASLGKPVRIEGYEVNGKKYANLVEEV